ncbi:MAG: TonB-dependent receptor [Bacteroidia bacterium]|nr:TonB-dependent receptor [Bacteroidia bacterium]
MAEGPISRKRKSSYLVNYRYSALGVFHLLGFEFGTGVAIPQYQDATFKLHFPDKKGSTSIFGLGGKSDIELFQSEDDSDNAYGDDYEDLRYGTNTGVIGITRTHKLGRYTKLKVVAAVNAARTQTHLDTFALDSGKIINYSGLYRDNSTQGKYTFNATVEHKFNSKSSLRSGVRFHQYFFELNDSVYNQDYGFWVEPTSFSGNTNLVQAFVNERYRINKRIKVNLGLSFSMYGLNNSMALEPRFGLKYKVNSKYTISAGYGLHSLLPPFRIYFEEITDSLGNKRKINQDLGFMRSHHYALAHDFSIGKNSRLKVETYYQHMFDVPVDGDGNVYYTLLNQGADFGVNFTENMQNNGMGRNYGLEITLERFMNKGFYFLNTLSLYRSQYTALNDIRYPTVFDSRYALNLLGGKEFYFTEKTNKKGKTSKASMTADVKFVVNGGQRHTPVDVVATEQQNEVVYVNSRTNELQYQEYARFDLRIAYKVQTKKMTQEWGIDIQNLTNRDNIFSTQYDPETKEYRITNQTGILPIGLYRITF